MGKFKSAVQRFGEFLGVAFRQSMKDNVLNSASGLVYSTLLAIVPALTFLFSFFSGLGVLEPLLNFLSEALTELTGGQTSEQVMTALTTYTRNATTLGIVGLISFLFTMVLLINKVWSVINQIYRSAQSTNPFKRFMGYMTFVIITTLLLALYVSVQSVFTDWYLNLIGYSVGAWSVVIKKVIPVLIIFIIFFLLIFFVPNTKVQFSAALIGSVSGVVIITVFTQFTGLLTSRAATFSVIYGSFAALFMFLFVCYVFWATIFFSVELAYVYQYRPTGVVSEGLPQSPATQMTDGTNIMMVIGANFRDGKGATTVKELLDRLVIPYDRLQGFLGALTNQGYIVATNNSRTSFIPNKPLDQIRLQDLVEHLYVIETIDEMSRDTAGEAVAKQLAEKGISSLGTLTVENLLQRI